MGCWSGVQGLAVGSGRRRLGSASVRDEHRRPRGIEGTHPGRSSCVRNAVTPSGSGPLRPVSRP